MRTLGIRIVLALVAIGGRDGRATSRVAGSHAGVVGIAGTGSCRAGGCRNDEDIYFRG